MKTNLRMLALAAPVWVSAAGAAAADVGQGGGAGGNGYHPHMWGEWGWGGMFMGPLFGILFIAAIAVAIVLVVRAVGGGAASGKRASVDGSDGRAGFAIKQHQCAQNRRQAARGITGKNIHNFDGDGAGTSPSRFQQHDAGGVTIA